MKPHLRSFIVGLLTFILGVAATLAMAPVKTYQVTGPVLAADAESITVKKGTENWQIARDSSTKVTGDVKVGANVTVQYRMSATAIDVKPAKK